MSESKKQDETPIASKRRKLDDGILSLNHPLLTMNKSFGSSSVPPAPPFPLGSGVPPPAPPFPPTDSIASQSESNITMKKINWTAIAPLNIPADSFWTKVDDEEKPSEDLFVGLTENFSTKPAKNKLALCPKKSSINLKVIDMRSAQNLLILLRVQYKNASYEQIRKYILDCDCSMLSVDFIESLLKNLPEPYKVKQLKELKEKNTELVDVEKFLVNICSIERLLPRLHFIIFKIRFNYMVSELTPDIEAGIAACHEVIASKKLQKILKLILTVGNIMNSGSSNRKAVGFELPILPKLNDIKDKDNKRTLLNYLVQIIEKKHVELLTFGDELTNVNRASRLNVKAIREKIEEMDELTKKLKAELEDYEVIRSPDDKFVEVMSPFSLQCVSNLEVLTNMINKMQNFYTKVGEFFAFEVTRYQMEQCFSDINTFKDMFYQATKEGHKILRTNEVENRPLIVEEKKNVDNEQKETKNNEEPQEEKKSIDDEQPEKENILGLQEGKKNIDEKEKEKDNIEEKQAERKATWINTSAHEIRRIMKDAKIRLFEIKLKPLKNEEIIAAGRSLQLFFNLRKSAMSKTPKK